MDRIILLVERLVCESHGQITELSVAGAALQMELIDVLVQSRHVTELNLTNGAVGNEAGGSSVQTSRPISEFWMPGTTERVNLQCCVAF